MESLESKVEQLCSLIMRTDNDNWEAKNRALTQMAELFLEHEGDGDAFTAALFRALKEPVKALVCDLRSQQVRDVCTLLTALAQASGDRMKLFLRDSFPHILEGVKVPNKVMSGYVDDCIFQMIRLTTFKSGISILAQEIKENKSKLVREKCLDYVNEMLINWTFTERELDPICESIRVGIEDASVKARETARITYGNLFLLFPHRSERIRHQLSKPMQTKLLAVEKLLREGRNNDESIHAETESVLGDSQGGASITSQQGASSHQPPPATPALPSISTVAAVPAPTPARPAVEPKTEVKRSGPTTRSNVTVTKPAATPAPFSRSQTTTAKRGTTPSSSSTTAVSHAHVSETPAPVANHGRGTDTKSAKADSSTVAANAHSNAISAAVMAEETGGDVNVEKIVIPAAVRGASRRRSVVKNPFAELSDTFANGTSVSSQQPNGPSPGKHTISSMLKASPVRRSPSKVNSPSTSAKVQSNKPFASSSSGNGATTRSATSAATNRSNPLLPPQTPRATAPPVPPSPSTPLHVVAAVQDQFVDSDSVDANEDGLTDEADEMTGTVDPSQAGDDQHQQQQQAILRVGSKVLVTWGKEPHTSREVGQVRFIGDTMFASGVWIGVELEMPMGKNNGSVQGHFYFSCPPNYGLFVREENVQIILTDDCHGGVGQGTGVISELSTTTDSTTSEQTQSSQKTQPDTNPVVTQVNEIQGDHQEIESGDSSDDQTLNMAMMGRSSSQSSNAVAAANRSKKSASSLKIKLSQMMNLLNQQLELVEELEQEERKVLQGVVGVSTNNNAESTGGAQQTTQGSLEKIQEIREEVYMITAQELDIIEGFRKRWKDICSL